MYAVLRLAGKQLRVEPEQRVHVPRLGAPVGSIIQCDDVLLFADGDDVRVGQPKLDDVKVSAEVVEHGRHDKIVVFKMKRRKNYRRKKGHRQGYTLLRIKDISG